MPAQAILTTVCVTGVAFYIRFLLAVCKDYNAHRIFSWARLRSTLSVEYLRVSASAET